MTVVKKADGATEESFALGVALGKSLTKGTVGLEIEIEGNKLPHENMTPSPWMYHADNSLRGDDTGEYVLSKPVEFDEVSKSLQSLWAVFKKMGSRLDDSNRTSVHVHLNVQPFFLNRLTSFMALYFTVEEVLTEWCGEHRVGNLFCLRAKDAPAIISQIRRFIRMNMEAPLKEHLHYSAMNANAIIKFGSLEFRTLRGVSDPNIIEEWVGILKRLYDLSADYKDPRDICGLFSGVGPLDFFEEVMGKKAAVIRNGISFSNEQLTDSMFEGIRLAQDLCYARDWSIFRGIELKPDPFHRDPKRIVKKLMGKGPGGTLSQYAGYDVAHAEAMLEALQNEGEETEPEDFPQEFYTASSGSPQTFVPVDWHQIQPQMAAQQPIQVPGSINMIHAGQGPGHGQTVTVNTNHPPQHPPGLHDYYAPIYDEDD